MLQTRCVHAYHIAHAVHASICVINRKLIKSNNELVTLFESWLEMKLRDSENVDCINCGVLILWTREVLKTWADYPTSDRHDV